jgi:hypothetical protein
MKTQTRSQQPIIHGLGKHFTSPTKARDKRKTTVIVRPPGQESKRRRLLEKLQLLRQPGPSSTSTSIANDSVQPPLDETLPMDVDADGWEDIETAGLAQSKSPLSPGPKVPRRILPDSESTRLYTAWNSLLPSLVNSLITYISMSTGHVVTPAMDLCSKCEQLCAPKDIKILCLYFDRKFTFAC